MARVSWASATAGWVWPVRGVGRTDGRVVGWLGPAGALPVGRAPAAGWGVSCVRP